jgi:hypothetical protein
MAQEGIFKNPVLLNQHTHKSVKVAGIKGFKFADEANSVLLAGNEFREASKSYPIVFVRDTNKNEILPLAVLGLRDNQNLFVDAEGKWKESSYIPAFFRRYPFSLADNQSQEGMFSVSIDAAFEGFDSEDGMLLFDEEGNPSKELNNVVEFLKRYQTDFMLTQELIKRLDEFSLFKDFSADITLPEGEKVGFKGMLMIDEQTLMKLEDEKALELYRKGFLSWIYSHLSSLSNFRLLANVMATESSGEEEKITIKE